MAKTYSGAQVHERIMDSISFMESRVRALDGTLGSIKSSMSDREKERSAAHVDLADAYLKGGDLKEKTFREDVQKYTGLDLTYVVKDFDAKQDKMRDDISDIEGSRLYLMRESLEFVIEQETENASRFEDDRVNKVIAIEEHAGYAGVDGKEGLRASGFLEGSHRKGFLWLRHRRLTKLAFATAQELGYTCFTEMENGQGGNFDNFEQQPGRRELRASVPLLLLYPDKSVMDIKDEVKKTVQKKEGLEKDLVQIDTLCYDHAKKELAKHFSVVRLENLLHGDVEEVKTYQGILKDLETQILDSKAEQSRVRAEQSQYTQKVGELNMMLAKYPSLKESEESISAEKIDKIFSHESGKPLPDMTALAELDRMIKREFPNAVAYKDYTRTTKKATTQEYNDVVKRAGGVEKWTEWRKV